MPSLVNAIQASATPGVLPWHLLQRVRGNLPARNGGTAVCPYKWPASDELAVTANGRKNEEST